jgi:hypothetical protein
MSKMNLHDIDFESENNWLEMDKESFISMYGKSRWEQIEYRNTFKDKKVSKKFQRDEDVF